MRLLPATDSLCNSLKVQVTSCPCHVLPSSPQSFLHIRFSIGLGTDMEFPQKPKLRFLHSESAINPVKLAAFRRVSTDAIKSSLLPGQPGSLKVRSDGTVLDGHHRLSILLERGDDIHQLPREIMERENHDA